MKFNRHLQSIRVAEKITQRVEGQLSKSQKEFLLRQQMRACLVEAFNDFIDAACLVEAPLVNSEYTWFGPFNKKARLDRALLSTDWFSLGDWVLAGLNRKTSDHSPVLLKNSAFDWGPRPFRFFNSWLESKDLIHQMRSAWNCNKQASIQHKFKSIRWVARDWNKHKLGNIDKRILEAEKQRDQLDNYIGSPSITSSVAPELDKLAIAKRQAFNSIKKIKYDDIIHESPPRIKQVFFEHFKNFLGEVHEEEIFTMGDLFSKKLSIIQSNQLVEKFSLEEVEIALHSTDKTKAPGPDGLNAGVISSLWPWIKSEVMAFFHEFHASGKIPDGSNSSFIALIPKKLDPILPSDFRLLGPIRRRRGG
ncbi:uncharacterized protein LOC135151374 [Daucus carota subsp. sativus]|uniref:uncharacterized protein LOC135151374 n=1 Tax=Daucus carota subsp. sativus TaxID=79200 RepID=UPI003082B57C